MLINGAKQHMDINIACCVKHRPNTNTANFLAGIHKYPSKNIKFEFVRFFGYAGRSHAFTLKRSRYSSQADRLPPPSFMKLNSGSSHFSGVCFRHFLRVIPKSLSRVPGIYNKNLLRKP